MTILLTSNHVISNNDTTHPNEFYLVSHMPVLLLMNVVNKDYLYLLTLILISRYHV